MREDHICVPIPESRSKDACVLRLVSERGHVYIYTPFEISQHHITSTLDQSLPNIMITLSGTDTRGSMLHQSVLEARQEPKKVQARQV